MKKYSIVVTVLLAACMVLTAGLLLKVRKQRIAIASLAVNLATRSHAHRDLLDSLSQSNMTAACTNLAGLILADVYLATVAVACDLPKAEKEGLFGAARLSSRQLSAPLLSGHPEVIRAAFITNDMDWTSYETIERSIVQKRK